MKDNKLENLLNDLKKESITEELDFKETENKTEENFFYDKPSPPRFDFNIKTDNIASPKFNVIWSENKETLLFSLLASIIVIVVGLISSYEYLAVIGSVSFMLFSVLVFITFFRYVLVAYQKSKVPEDIINRINVIEKKIDYISKKETGLGLGRSKDLENEVQEIKSVLKTVLGSLKK
ncbi:MAG: hypothetical protein AB1602_08865 [Elusimicrobiota bacterium]